MASRKLAIPRVASFKTVAQFKRHLDTLPIPVACDEAVIPAPDGPLAQPCLVAGRRVGVQYGEAFQLLAPVRLSRLDVLAPDS